VRSHSTALQHLSKEGHAFRAAAMSNWAANAGWSTVSEYGAPMRSARRSLAPRISSGLAGGFPPARRDPREAKNHASNSCFARTTAMGMSPLACIPLATSCGASSFGQSEFASTRINIRPSPWIFRAANSTTRSSSPTLISLWRGQRMGVSTCKLWTPRADAIRRIVNGTAATSPCPSTTGIMRVGIGCGGREEIHLLVHFLQGLFIGPNLAKSQQFPCRVKMVLHG